MPRLIVLFVRSVDKLNYGIGRFAMYLLFALMGVLLWSTVSKAFFYPSNWTLETAQFIMVAYYILGGPYSMQLGSHVRMDLLYANWSPIKVIICTSFVLMILQSLTYLIRDIATIRGEVI